MQLRHLAAGIAMALGASVASASPVIIDGANNLPSSGDCTFACLTSYQQVYSASLFSGTVDISKVEFRYSYDGNAWSAGNNYSLTIGIANGGVNGLTANQAGNMASSQLFGTQSFTGTSTQGGWYGFSGNYVYDSSLGDLIIWIQRTAGSSSSVSTDYNGDSGGEFSRTFAGDGWCSLASACVGSDYGNVTRLEVNAAQGNDLPEPASLALVGLGLLAAAGVRRRAAR